MRSFPRSRAVQITTSAVFVILLVWYIYCVLKVWRADWLQDQRNKQHLEASARLEMWDARTQWMLGRYFLNAAQDQTRALAHLRRAVKLNPFEGRYWLDLAAAYEVAGDGKASGEALEQALKAEPTSPSIAWESANFYLSHNDTTRALPLFRVVITYGSGTAAQAAIDLCWRATRNVNQIASRVLPPNPEAYFTLLNILSAQSQSAPANELWKLLTDLKLKFATEETFPYFDYLIKTHEVDQAEDVWRVLEQTNFELIRDHSPNAISDGGFERKYLNGGFGWRDAPQYQVEVSLDTSQFHTGTRALKFFFTGPGVADTGVYQFVPIKPSQAYRLAAFIKTEDIVSASGPRLVVQDFYSNQILASTDDLLGTSGWREQKVDFTTGPQTRLIALKVMRVPGNPMIKGTFWLDDVTLTPVN